MTDLRSRLDSMLGGEPSPPRDLDNIVATGRRALRRRNAITGAAGTAGAAALTAAVVVPIVAVSQHDATSTIAIAHQTPTPTPSSHCRTVMVRHHAFHGVSKRRLRVHDLVKWQQLGRVKSIRIGHGHVIAVRICSSPTPDPTSGSATPTPTATAPPAPRYHYTERPSRISHRLADALASRLDTWGMTPIYQRPFAQETSRLEKGHPAYFDGNDDVSIGGKPADVGLQVTHAVTTQVPFTGPCVAPRCVQTTLHDGSVEQTAHRRSGTGGAMVISVEVHRPNGLVVEAQQANYGFGPEATKARSRQPLTLAQLRDLAEDPTVSF